MAIAGNSREDWLPAVAGLQPASITGTNEEAAYRSI